MSPAIESRCKIDEASLIKADASAWYDETHLVVAMAAGCYKWFNAAAADMIRIKAPGIENGNHYLNNPTGAQVTAEMVLSSRTDATCLMMPDTCTFSAELVYRLDK